MTQFSVTIGYRQVVSLEVTQFSVTIGYRQVVSLVTVFLAQNTSIILALSLFSVLVKITIEKNDMVLSDIHCIYSWIRSDTEFWKHCENVVCKICSVLYLNLHELTRLLSVLHVDATEAFRAGVGARNAAPAALIQQDGHLHFGLLWIMVRISDRKYTVRRPLSRNIL